MEDGKKLLSLLSAGKETTGKEVDEALNLQEQVGTILMTKEVSPLTVSLIPRPSPLMIVELL